MLSSLTFLSLLSGLHNGVCIYSCTFCFLPLDQILLYKKERERETNTYSWQSVHHCPPVACLCCIPALSLCPCFTIFSLLALLPFGETCIRFISLFPPLFPFHYQMVYVAVPVLHTFLLSLALYNNIAQATYASAENWLMYKQSNTNDDNKDKGPCM